jgi:methyl-accepting chemotaxis protein
LVVVLFVCAGVALCFAAVCVVVAVRGRNAYLAQSGSVRSALEAAAAETLDELVVAYEAARRRNESVSSLLPAADEIVDRQRLLVEALALRQQAAAREQQAVQLAVREIAGSEETLSRLTEEIGAVSAGVEQTVATVAMLSQNVAGLAENVGTVSSSIGELAVSVNQVAGSARDASMRTLEADTKAKDGAVAVERLVRSTREIAEDIGAVVAMMEELGAASGKIGTIVETIDAIADQTNLLALNAAIEAARAGEQGRGFAVVADEIRKLAERSAQSTREIGQLIGDIQRRTTQVVRSTSASRDKVDAGLEMADVAGRAISDISAAVGQANRLAEEISMAAREQATTSSGIVDSVEQMNTLTRATASSLQEQAVAGRQITTGITAIDQHTKVVDDAVVRQRAAFDRVSAESEILASARAATRDALNGFDDLTVALRDRIAAFGEPQHRAAGVPPTIAAERATASLLR